MLYRTHHPFFFPNNPFTFFSLSLSLLFPSLLCNHSPKPTSQHAPLILSSPYSGSLPAMECLDAALKTCFRNDISLQLSPQLSFHDHTASFHPQNVVSSDDFFVDELLDFSNDDEFVQQDEIAHEDDDDKASVSLSISLSAQEQRQNSVLSDLPSLPSGAADDLANLEWLSHFVEDSFSGFSAPFPSAGISSSMKSSAAEEQPENDGSVSPPEPCFKTPVPVKARSKRTRTGGRVWCLASPSLTESSSSSTTSSSSSSPAGPWLIISDRFEPEIPVTKKPKRKSPLEKARTVAGAQPPRRCSHCGVQKTPQWRTGPLGAKTLCNACGVRFKSGRLLPEYRPACSPTFSSELHSNHHRKVLEMRRKKETTAPAEFLTSEKE